MPWDSKILIDYSPQERSPPYQTRFQMHWDRKILINYLPQQRPPILWGQISNALRWVASLEVDNWIVFYYPRPFEILPYKMGGLRWLIKAMREKKKLCSLNIISCSHNLSFCSHKKDILFQQHIILFPQYIILFPQHIILFPQYIILFPQHIILFPQYINLFPQHIILLLQYIICSDPRWPSAGEKFNIGPYGKYIQRSSPQKLLGQLEPNLVTIVLEWPPSKLSLAGPGPIQDDCQLGT